MNISVAPRLLFCRFCADNHGVLSPPELTPTPDSRHERFLTLAGWLVFGGNVAENHCGFERLRD
jgi:hypothetical protein